MQKNLVVTKPMDNFRFEIFDDVNNPHYTFYKLYIEDKCFFDEFLEEEVTGTPEEKDYNSIISMMDYFSPQIQLPKKKFRHIEWSERDDLFEFKKNQMRVYVVKQDDAIYIVMGGWKKNQKSDISKLKKRIKTFNN